MLERFNYTNSFNETLEFGKNSLFVNENDLRDFAWDITTKNNKISGFKKGIVSKTIPVIIKCSTETEGMLTRNRLFEVFEKDVLAGQYGKIQIGDYYLRCYITGSKKSEYLVHKSYMVVSLTVQTDLPEWIREVTLNYGLSAANPGKFLDFPFDFQYDFANELADTSITNPGIIATNFIMTIQGEVANPTLYIGDHKYSVNVTIGAGEHLTINSLEKTIVLTKTNGEKVNCFKYRDRESYIFEKIPAGTNEITTTSGLSDFRIILLDERSEPKWT